MTTVGNSIISVRIQIHRLCLAGLLIICTPAFGQEEHSLDRLIFDPVPLDQPDYKPGNHYSPLQTVVRAGNDGTTTITGSEADHLYEQIRQYRDGIAESESEDGPYARELFEDLFSLARLNQQMGDHQKAISLLERAEHISRINNGLFSSEQYPVIEKEIESYLALGRLDLAYEKQRYLLYLNREFYGGTDIQIVPALMELADLNIRTFNKAMMLPNSTGLSISISAGGPKPDHPPPPRVLGFLNLNEAQYNLSMGILNMLNHHEFFHPLLLDMEYKLLETIFLQANRQAMVEDPQYYISVQQRVTGSLHRSMAIEQMNGPYRMGKDSFSRILLYIANNPRADAEDLALAMTEYGDWHLLFGHLSTARKQYRQAYETLEQSGADQASLDALFSPPLPVQLPLITSRPNSREKFGISPDAKLDYDGYIDITFTINRYGKARKFKIIGKSDSAGSDVVGRLRKMLRNSPFRPRFVNGKPATKDTVSVRYYFTYA